MIFIPTRAHINTLELELFHHTFLETNNDRIQSILQQHHVPNIHLVSDSQNSTKILLNVNYPQDDALIQAHKSIERQLQYSAFNPCFQSQIYVQWVHGYDKSKYNDELDGFATISAILYIKNNHKECYCKGYPISIISSKSKNNPC